MKTINILVAIAPAIVCAMLGFFIELWPKIFEKLKAASRMASVVEVCKEAVVHAAFYGTTVAGVLAKMGALGTVSVWFYVVVAVWFIGLMAMAFRLSLLLHVLEKEEADEALEATYLVVADALLEHSKSRASAGESEPT